MRLEHDFRPPLPTPFTGRSHETRARKLPHAHISAGAEDSSNYTSLSTLCISKMSMCSFLYRGCGSPATCATCTATAHTKHTLHQQDVNVLVSLRGCSPMQLTSHALPQRILSTLCINKMSMRSFLYRGCGSHATYVTCPATAHTKHTLHQPDVNVHISLLRLWLLCNLRHMHCHSAY